MDTPYHVRSRDGFPAFAHHDSVSALWSQRWRPPCAAGSYPFTDGRVEDFDPVFAELSRISADDPAVLYRPDDYAKPFFPVADRLTAAAREAASRENLLEARDLYLRAAAVYRIARFPVNRSPLSQEAWEKGKAAYEQGGRLLDPPSNPVEIPFTHADPAAGDHGTAIPAHLRLPRGPAPAGGWPVLLFICGLDAYRTDHTPRTQAHVDRGFATISFEIPGTGDCPAAANDPASPDRLMSSVLDWVATAAAGHGLDAGRVFARGISTGGYYALRLAHTHADRLAAVVAQGGGGHHMFDAAWIHAQNRMEYPFALADALAHKFGYRDPDPAAAVARYAAEAGKFSLAGSGVLDRPSCRLLVINGMEDSIFPIEDSILAATRGGNKDLVVRGNRGHMGNPGAEEIVYAWLDEARDVGSGSRRS
ncbi:alpha/beta hydrolase family protein [Amycolatopsis sp. cmx-4-61]|uniref:alpha/beta hydrolase family protein n=1 Tax=Amycolatopsis sp. cmx-4-61 TaxID=2790937 RepID=UPI00397E8075